MGIVAKASGGGFPTAPEGLYCAVCTAVEDAGVMVGQFGPKPKVRIRWQLDERDPSSGRRYSVQQLFTLSIHEKSLLGQRLESWLGRKFSDADRVEGFDLESLVGKTCQVQLVHAPGKNGAIYANVQNVVAAPKGFSLEIEECQSDNDEDESPF